MTDLLQRLVTRHAERDGGATAVRLGEERLAYGDLARRANRIAWTLRDAGCRKGDRVALFVPKSPDAVAAILGVLEADCVYVPIDLASPPARVSRILDLCAPRALVGAVSAGALLAGLAREGGLDGGAPLVWLSGGEPPVEAAARRYGAADLESAPVADPPACNGPADPAYILFTSGSTGVPKGVVITHANVARFLEWAIDYFGLSAADRVSGHSPLHFDLSVFDIFGALASGAELHLVPPDVNVLPHKLAEFIRASELTQWFSVPSALNYLAKFDAVGPGDFPALRRLLWCGEVLPTPVLRYLMQRLPHVTFTNLYGPTEATIASSYYTVPECPPDDRAPIPIGRPCGGEELLVLDPALRPVPPGEIGHIFIRGVGLSPGYWNDPERTREAFVSSASGDDPSERLYRTGDLGRLGDDGLVYFCGRADTQVKSRGYRIELGEIESALQTLPWLRESAVVAIPTGGFEGYGLCCAYVPAEQSQVSPTRLRQELTRLLPAYMLPGRWLAFEHLPKNANGKVDRRRLRELFEAHDASPSRSA